MNYLVHLYLAGKSHGLQLGGLMGDFVKGPIPHHYPEEIRLGLHLHRRIDTFSSTNHHTRNSRHALNARLGHGRGIIVDIFYDHFLAAEWNLLHPTPLDVYTQDVYALLRSNSGTLPEGLQRIAPRMIEYDWLSSYRHRDVVGKALQRIAQRLSRPLPLETALHDLDEHQENLRDHFKAFLAEAKEFSCRELGRDLYC